MPTLLLRLASIAKLYAIRVMALLKAIVLHVFREDSFLIKVASSPALQGCSATKQKILVNHVILHV